MNLLGGSSRLTSSVKVELNGKIKRALLGQVLKDTFCHYAKYYPEITNNIPKYNYFKF